MTFCLSVNLEEDCARNPPAPAVVFTVGLLWLSSVAVLVWAVKTAYIKVLVAYEKLQFEMLLGALLQLLMNLVLNAI